MYGFPGIFQERVSASISNKAYTTMVTDITTDVYTDIVSAYGSVNVTAVIDIGLIKTMQVLKIVSQSSTVIGNSRK